MALKLRAQQIIIDTPKEDSKAWIHIMVQEVFMNEDGETTNVVPRSEFLHKDGEEIGMEFYEYYDPVLGTTQTISGYGLQMAIRTCVTKWIQEADGGVIDDAGNLMV